MKVNAVDSTRHTSPTRLTPETKQNTQVNHDKVPGQREIQEDQVINAIEKANKSLELTRTRIEFSIHDKTKEIIVRVYDKENDELIREIPPEKILDLVAKLCEMAGLIVDEKV